MHPNVRRVQAALEAAGLKSEVREMPQSTATAREAAEALGTTLDRIVKSLLWLADGEPVLVLVSGARRVDEAKLARALSGFLGREPGELRRADAATVKETTGFPVGGVPPAGHLRPLPTLVDRNLLDGGEAVLWAAAGTPRTLFPVTAAELLRLTGGEPVDVAE
ncbi:MAG: YbaK/EbsC family protein [Bacillota bacterium]|nr:YbaK/EbsC family protein [Bacillota bacterium]